MVNTAQTVGDLWKIITGYIRKNFPDLASGFRPGLSAAEVAGLEETLRRRLPDDFKEMLQAGAYYGSTGIIPDPQRLGRGYNHAFRLMSPALIVDQWQMQNELFDSGEYDDRHADTIVGEGIVKLWWSPGWIPFAENGGGDYYCIDLVPTYPGQRGQVVFFCHETSHRPLIAPSITAYLAGLAAAMQGGAYELSSRGTCGLVRRTTETFPDARDE